MTEQPITVAVIIGSVRAGRLAPIVARWFLERAHHHQGIAVDVVDLADLDLPADHGDGGDSEAFRDRIDVADAVVVITPEYNRGYPGYLKIAIDTAREQWANKPVAFVAYSGGAAGGLRAVEQLRAVFTELEATTIRESVSFPFVEDHFDEGGAPANPQRSGAAATSMLTQLTWWARALRAARTATSAGLA